MIPVVTVKINNPVIPFLKELFSVLFWLTFRREKKKTKNWGVGNYTRESLSRWYRQIYLSISIYLSIYLSIYPKTDIVLKINIGIFKLKYLVQIYFCSVHEEIRRFESGLLITLKNTEPREFFRHKYVFNTRSWVSWWCNS